MEETKQAAVQERVLAHGESIQVLPRGELAGPVKLQHVAPYAKKGCPSCFGRGYLTKHIGEDKTFTGCGCAFRRFLRERVAEVGAEPGTLNLFWRVGHEPDAEPVHEVTQ